MARKTKSKKKGSRKRSSKNRLSVVPPNNTFEGGRYLAKHPLHKESAKIAPFLERNAVLFKMQAENNLTNFKTPKRIAYMPDIKPFKPF